MTKQNKLIVGAVVVLVGLYLYKQNKVKNEVSDLKNGADVTPLAGGDRSTLERPLVSENLENTGGFNPFEDMKKGKAQVTKWNFPSRIENSYFNTTLLK